MHGGGLIRAMELEDNKGPILELQDDEDLYSETLMQVATTIEVVL